MRNNSSTRRDDRYLGAEAARLRAKLSGYGGSLALRIGGGKGDWLGCADYDREFLIGTNCPGVSLKARAQALPVGEASVDLVMLIHVLGGTDTDASVAILTEAARVLRGEGRLVVVERRLPQSFGAWRGGFAGRLMHCRRLRRLVRAAGLEWRGDTELGQSRLHFGCTRLGMSAYAALAVKRVYGARVLRLRWKEPRSHRQAVLQERGHAG